MSNDHEKDALVDRATVAETRLNLAQEVITEMRYWPQRLSRPEIIADLIANQEAYFGTAPIEPPAAEIAVTDEMRKAGVAIYESARDDFERSGLDAIYRAMSAVAPTNDKDEFRRRCWQMDVDKRIVAEDARDAALRQKATVLFERDEAVVARDYWHDMHRHLRSSFDDVNAKLMDTRRQVTGLEAELALAREMIAALTTPQAPPGDVTTASKPNPFRSFDGDRRRVGG